MNVNCVKSVFVWIYEHTFNSICTCNNIELNNFSFIFSVGKDDNSMTFAAGET